MEAYRESAENIKAPQAAAEELTELISESRGERQHIHLHQTKLNGINADIYAKTIELLRDWDIIVSFLGDPVNIENTITGKTRKDSQLIANRVLSLPTFIEFGNTESGDRIKITNGQLFHLELMEKNQTEA